jgi:DNA-binding response OmpR family regulator
MKILIIEDVIFRQDFIANKLGTDDFDRARRADIALELLQENDYDVIFFDHDLVGARSGSDITMEWANAGRALQPKRPLVIIHSMNMEGAGRMETHLKGLTSKTLRIPFRNIVQGEIDLKALIATEA